jgi:hypothetical protein
MGLVRGKLGSNVRGMLRGVLENVTGRARDEIPAARRPTLPIDIYLSMGMSSIRLFRAGPVDEFAFFQRSGVPLHHDVEFLTWLEPERASAESYEPYGCLWLRRGSLPLFEPERVQATWKVLRQRYGITRVPLAEHLAARPFRAFDPRLGTSHKAGRNRLSPSTSALGRAKAGHRRLSHAEILEVLRGELDPATKIAWLEDSFFDPPEPGEVVHRYYLTRDLQVHLVRHHWREGKRLIAADVRAEVLDGLSSGTFSRAA